MIWSCIIYRKIGLVILMSKESKTAKDYVKNILSEPLWNFYTEETENRGMVLIMEDDAPIVMT